MITTFDLIFWITTLIGSTHIITGTSIFEKWRNLMDKVSPNFFGVLFSCPTCMGFWVGVIWCKFGYSVISLNTLNLHSIYFLFFLHGCFGSFLGWTANLLTSILDEYLTGIQLKHEIIVNDPLKIAREILNEEKTL